MMFFAGTGDWLPAGEGFAACAFADARRDPPQQA